MVLCCNLDQVECGSCQKPTVCIYKIYRRNVQASLLCVLAVNHNLQGAIPTPVKWVGVKFVCVYIHMCRLMVSNHKKHIVLHRMNSIKILSVDVASCNLDQVRWWSSEFPCLCQISSVWKSQLIWLCFVAQKCYPKCLLTFTNDGICKHAFCVQFLQHKL